MRINNFDVTEVVRDFLNTSTMERQDLIQVFTQEVADNRAVRELLARLAIEAANNKLAPTQVLALGLTYGSALGVLLERERVQRKVV